MKKFTITFFWVLISICTFGQKQINTLDQATIGETVYDLQTWRAMQHRIVSFDDNTFGIVWNQADEWPAFPDQGIGYSYYNGDSWITLPNTTITSVWAIFPSYAQLGESGELCISQGQNGLVMSSRELKGSGDWNENYTPGTNYKYPCLVTSGPNHFTVHLLYLDPDPAFTPTPAQPLRGSIRYSRSTDGGQTWDIQNQAFDELNADHYLGFTIGAYAWAQAREETLAFVAGDFLTDLVLMKSTDGGDSWQKTVIWEHPYPFLEMSTVNTDTFYCDDGGISVALDNEGKAHVAFTLSRVFSSTAQDTNYYDTGVGGVVYWNEDRPTFSNNINALNPYGDPASELIPDYSLIGYIQLGSGKGENEILGNFGTYPTPGLFTMPQILAHDWMGIVLTWSGVTASYTFGDDASLRHLWSRMSPDNGSTWGNSIDLNTDLIFAFSEVVYPSLAANSSSDELYYAFQEDVEPGLSGGNTTYDMNNIWFFPFSSGTIPTPWVTASFYADTTTINAGDSIQFFNESNGFPANSLSYDWYFEGGIPLVSNDTNPIVTYPVEGVFDVSLQATVNGNVVDSLLIPGYIHVLPTIGFTNNDVDINDWNIYPNPSTGEIQITGLNIRFNGRVRIVNVLSHEVYNKPWENNSNNLIDLGSLSDGIYFVILTEGSKSSVKKIVLNR